MIQRTAIFLLLLCAYQAQADVKLPEPAPLVSEKLITKLAFSSGMDASLPQPIWKTIQAQQPDLFISIGNNFPLSERSLSNPADSYKLQALQPEFAIFRSQIPIIASWDTNDYGSLSPKNSGADNPKKEISKLDYIRFFPNDAGRMDSQQSGIYHAFNLGPKDKRCQILILDEHSFRSNLLTTQKPVFPKGPYLADKGPKARLLGEAQWKWLEDQLKKPAGLRILVTPVQFLPEGTGYEAWSNFPAEKKRLLGLLKKLNIKNLLFLSGNRLHGQILQSSIEGKAVYIEATAGGLNRSAPELQNPQIIAGPNFGVLEINWEKRLIRVKLVRQDASVAQSKSFTW